MNNSPLITRQGLHRVDMEQRNEHGFPVCCNHDCNESDDCPLRVSHPFAGEPKTNWKPILGPLVVLLAVIAAVVIVVMGAK